MKLYSILLMGILCFAFMSPMVLAENETVLGEDVISSEPISEDSSTSVFWDKWRRAFVFNKAKKAEISMRIAEKRMLRAGELAELGETEKAKQVAEEYEEAMEKAEEYLDASEENGVSEVAKKALARTYLIQNRIEAHEERALEIKARILENKADTMTEEQLQHLEDVFSRIEDRAERAQERVLQRQKNMKTKYKVLENLTDEELAAAVEAHEKRVEEQRQIRDQRVENRRMVIDQRREMVKDKVLNSSDAEDSEKELEDESEEVLESNESESSVESESSSSQVEDTTLVN
jgi:hypothetical protein